MPNKRALSILVYSHTARLAPRVKQELNTLSDAGADVTVLHWGRGDASAESTDQPWAKHRLNTNAPIGRLGAVLYLPWLYIRLLAALSWQDVDVIHLTHLLFLPLAPFVRIGGVKIVYDSYEFHALDLSLRFPTILQPWIEWIVKSAENTLVRTVDCVLTVDSVDDHLARRYRRVCDAVTVLYNVPGVMSYQLSSAPDHSDNTPSRLIYVGGITIEKGAIRAIKAVRELRDEGHHVTLHFIGTVQGGGVWFQQAVQNADVADIVEHRTWLSYEAMLGLIIGADVALALHQPTERFKRVSTGNGRKFFTYMEAGLPIVGPSFGEVGQVVTEANCGWLTDTSDTNAVVTVISNLLDSPNKRSKMGVRGRRAVEEQFNWDVEKRKLITAYNDIADVK